MVPVGSGSVSVLRVDTPVVFDAVARGNDIYVFHFTSQNSQFPTGGVYLVPCIVGPSRSGLSGP